MVRYFILENCISKGLSVSTLVALNEGAKEVVPLDSSAKFAFDGKLIYHVGIIQTNQVCDFIIMGLCLPLY